MAADLAFYLPGGSIALRQAKETLASGKRPAKARLVSLLLTYAPWEEIWKLMDEDQIRKLFPHLDLPPGIHRAWARWLGLLAR